MHKESFLVIFVCILIVYRSSCQLPDGYVLKIYKLFCGLSDNEYFANNFTCRLKAVDRHKGVANIEGWIVKDVKNMTVHLQLFKYYSQFRPYLMNFTLNFCDLMSHSYIPNFYAHLLMRMMENKTNIFKQCPLTGFLYVRGVWMDANRMKLPLPLGRYKLTLRYFENYPQKYIGEISFFAETYLKNQWRKNATKTDLDFK